MDRGAWPATVRRNMLKSLQVLKVNLARSNCFLLFVKIKQKDLYKSTKYSILLRKNYVYDSKESLTLNRHWICTIKNLMKCEV